MGWNDSSPLVVRTMLSLREEGSWCGETHVQKTIYLCQELLGAPQSFKYVLYKHGPYSFQLSDHLQQLISDHFIDVVPQPAPYGPTLAVSDGAKSLVAKDETARALGEAIGVLSRKLSKKNVSELEKLATAVFVKRSSKSDDTIEQRAEKLNKLKPHVSIDAAVNASREADGLIAEFSKSV